MNEIYSGMLKFETKLADESINNLVEGAQYYESMLDGMTKEAKEALGTVYTIYAEYLALINDLSKEGRNALANLGLTTTGYQSIRDAFLAN